MSPRRSLVRRRRSLTALPVLVALLAMSACGDSDDSDDDSDSNADTTTATTAAPVTSVATPATTTEPSPATTESSSETTDASETEYWTAAPPNMTPVDDDTAAQWQEWTDKVLVLTEGTPGAVVAVSDPELGFWSTAVGEAEVGVDAMTLEHHSRIGSITKTFTAVAILQLVDAGELSLDDTVADVVPDLTDQFPDAADITIEHLLSMTSGLPDYANVPGAATAQAVEDPTKIWTPEELIEAALGAAEVQPIGTPGYSTTNFTILGLIYEAVTGDTIEAGVKGVAEEAGLTETALLPGDQNDMPDPSTHGYVEASAVSSIQELSGIEVEAGTDTTDWSLSWGGAGGGAYSTIDDLFLWASTASGTTLLSNELGTRRVDLQTSIPDEGLQYGLGVMSPFVDGWIGHSGQAIGWEALAFYDPETGATFTAMINSTEGANGFYLLWNQIFELGLDVPDLDTIPLPESGDTDDSDGPAGDDTDSGDTGGDEAGEASGSMSLNVGDVTVEATIVACTLEPAEFRAEGETSGVILSMVPDDSGQANIVVSGGLQFEGRGDITVDGGQVIVVGSGAAPDDSAPVEDFTLEASIESC